MDTRSEENEAEPPRFYHLELYDSAEDLELFSEEPFRRRDLGLCETSKTQGAEEQRLPSVGNARESDKGEDTYCITCCVPIRADGQQGGDHSEHEVIPLSSVVEIAKDEFRKNVCRLEDQITHLESFSSHLEEIFITIEENFARQEQNLERGYNDLMLTLEQRYEEVMQALGEEKKEKLEGLYEQLVSCGGNLDTCKDLMETIEDLSQGENKVNAIKAAVATSHRLVDFLKKDVDIDLSVPTNFEARVIDFSDIQELMDSINSVPAPLPPCAPVMNTQDPNSATGTSVRVCWSFFSEDIVESYQLYYKRVSNETSKEEQDAFMLNVKETYCTVTNLAPNAQYEFWVKALNRAGVGSASERAVYITAPLAPVLKRKEIQSCEHAALVRWESGNTNPVDSYTAELSKLTDGEDGNIITESIVGIPNCEALIQLEPGHNYLLSVKAVNMGGSSERSEPVSILSTGTSFTLNEETAHPLLSVLEDGLTIACCKTESPKCEWPFRENSFTRHTYEFLNNGMTPDITITVPPRRIGLLLDYDKGSLSFFNTDIMQHLYTFHNHFQDFVCPCFALEEPGTLRILNGVAMPTYTIS
ncbi:fibronectin type III and SPRY domain-containing protein 2 isoform X2 [Podarcis muralis]